MTEHVDGVNVSILHFNTMHIVLKATALVHTNPLDQQLSCVYLHKPPTCLSAMHALIPLQ